VHFLENNAIADLRQTLVGAKPIWAVCRYKSFTKRSASYIAAWVLRADTASPMRNNW
jgi:hypothetical protein